MKVLNVSRAKWLVTCAILWSAILAPHHCFAGISIGEIYGPLSLDTAWPPQGEGGPCWSPDGTKIVFSWGDGYTAWDPSVGGYPNPEGSYIVIMTADGQAIRGPDNPLVNDPYWDNHSPDWSTDGNWIVYAGSRVGPAYIARVSLIDGTVVQILGTIGGHPKHPKWSPDGTKIAYLGGGWGGSPSYHICVTDPDGSSHEDLTPGITGYGMTGLSWSPDGTRIVFTQEGEPGLLVLNVVTKNVTTLPGFPSGLTPSTPVWASDNSILFNSTGGIYDYQIDTQTTTQLTYGPDYLGYEGPAYDHLGDWHSTAGLVFSSSRGCTVRWDSNVYIAPIVTVPELVTIGLDAPDEAWMDYPYRVNIEVSTSDFWPGGEASIVVTENRGPTHATWDIHDNEYWHSYIWGGEWRQRPDAKWRVYVYDNALDEWVVKDEDYEFGVENIAINLASSDTIYCYLEGYHRWFWIEPWDWDRVADILLGMGSGFLDKIISGAVNIGLIGKEVCEASGGQHEITYNYTATCEGVEANDSTTVKVPIEKYILLGESMVLHAEAFIATSIGGHVGWVIEVGSIILAEGAYVLASDPPDFNYTQIAVPQIPEIPELSQIDDPDHVEAANKALELAAVGVALRTSMERYEGAKIDGKPEYMALQLEAARFYAGKIVELTSWLADFWTSFGTTLPIPTPEQIQEIRENLEQNGLPELEVAILSEFGYTAQEMTEMADTIATLPDEYFTSPEKIGIGLYIIVDGTTEYIEYIPETPSGVVLAELDIDPDTLNLEGKGKWITCYIELPNEYNVGEIDVSSLTLQNSLNAESSPTEVGDHDNDGIPDLMVKFNRQELIQLVQAGQQIIALIGQLDDGTPLAAVDVIRVIH